MYIEDLLKYDISDDEFLEASNEDIDILSILDQEAILDFVAMAADNEPGDAYRVFSDFDAKEALGMTANEVMHEYVNKAALLNWVQTMNDNYCSQRNLCHTCRSHLVEKYVNGVPTLMCPNGCV